MNDIEFENLKRLMQMFSVILVTVGIILILSISPSRAQSGICTSLNAQLASLNSNRSNSGSSAKYRRYDAAVREQTVQLNKTVKIGHRKGCIGLGILSLRNSQCKRITRSLDRMEDNLAKLKRQRAQYSPQQLGNSNKRQKILRSLRNNDCNKRQAASFNSQSASNTNQQPVRKKRRRTLLEQIFGVRSYNENGSRSNRYNENAENNPLFSGGTFRTLCVRKTDGYYFPISFSTTHNFFERDDQACRSMCPSTEVALYFHKMPSEDSEDMISYDTQQPYASEDFAFLYRKKFDRETACRFSKPELAELKEVTVPGSRPDKFKKRNVIGIPLQRIDSNLSPDDTENQFAKVDMTKAKYYLIKKKHKEMPSSAIADIPKPDKNKKIRIVGGVYFPVQ